MAAKRQSAWQRLFNNVLSRAEALLYVVILLAIGAAGGGIATHYLGW